MILIQEKEADAIVNEEGRVRVHYYLDNYISYTFFNPSYWVKIILYILFTIFIFRILLDPDKPILRNNLLLFYILSEEGNLSKSKLVLEWWMRMRQFTASLLNLKFCK